MQTKIVVADDEINIADSISYALKREGFTVYTAYDGEEALEYVNRVNPEILILDVMMPKLNGYDVCRAIPQDKMMGIIMLTAKDALIDKVLGLELGADDYVTKPFDIAELIARIRSLSRRINKSKSEESQPKKIEIGELKININERTIYLGEEMIYLKPKEFDLLTFLVRNKKITFSRDKILESVWGMEYLGGTRTVDIHIQRIRKSLGVYGKIIKTVPKIGYKVVGGLDEN